MMVDLRNLQTLHETDEGKAQELISKLLSCWSIPRAKSIETKMDYDFIVQNGSYFNTLFSLCGYTLHVTRSPGEEVVYLESFTAGNRRKFNKQESIVILRLLKFYLEARTKITLGGGSTSITAEDLLHGVNATRKAPMESKELFKILDTLEGYNLIRLPGKKSSYDGSTVIGIMPSIASLLPNDTLETIECTLQAYANETSRKRFADNAQTPDEPEDTEISEEHETPSEEV